MSLAEDFITNQQSVPEKLRGHIKDYDDELHRMADHTQNIVSGAIDCGDGSAVLTFVTPKPKYEGAEVPAITDDTEAHLAVSASGKLYRAWVTKRAGGEDGESGRGPAEGRILESEWRPIEETYISPGAGFEPVVWTDRLGQILERHALQHTVQLG